MNLNPVRIRCLISGLCKHCGQVVYGWIVLNSYAQIIDCEGLVVCSDGLICDPCIRDEAEKKAIVEGPREKRNP